MIAKVVRGYRPGGLLAYLFGPGQHEEHRDPRVVASWDGAPWAHQPDPCELPGGQTAGEFDLDLRALIKVMEAGPRRLGLPLRTPPALPADWRQALVDGRRLPATAPGWARMWRYDPKLGDVVLRPGYVWHCPVRLAPGDRTLSDSEWETIAKRLMRATGIQQAGCRWVAVRHAEDHIHLMATLVSETTGKRFHPYRDFYALRDECRAIERELGLTETAPADRTARPAPTRAERAKSDRSRRTETPRDELHRLVSLAAATATSGETFMHALRERGLDPAVRRDESGHIVGYTVALPGDITAAGEKVRYAGRALAPDLTWPMLRARWASIGHRQFPDAAATGRTALSKDERTAARLARRGTLASAAGAVDDGGTALREAMAADPPNRHAADSIAHAAGELAAVLAHAAESRDDGRWPLSEIAQRFDRATRSPHRVVPSPDSEIAGELRLAARLVAAGGAIGSRGSESRAALALVLALAGLGAEIAAWRELSRHSHQAAAARNAADGLARHATVTTCPPAGEDGDATHRSSGRPGRGRSAPETPCGNDASPAAMAATSRVGPPQP